MKHTNYAYNNRPELLAPAGNMECLISAVVMGADAVYLSGKEFGARSYADNFDDGELKAAVRYCHLRNVKVHITVNTIVGDKEIPALREYLLYLDEIGADALIIQDLGVLSLAKSLAVRPQLHASTQLTVHNLSGALSAAKLGFDRVVLARELSFDEIKYISENCSIETEIFVHGAMCMSYSGQCLMSSMLGGRSGNRGRCAQPCRQAYKYKSSAEKFCLSLKDMSLADRLDKVALCGAASLKIEGRMKGSAYVGCVVKTYADCLREKRKPTKNEIERMNRVFYRGGQSAGYFDGAVGTEMFAFNKPDNPYKSGSNEVAKEIAAEVSGRLNKYKIKLSCDIEIRVGSKISMKIHGDGISADIEGDTVIESASSKPISEEMVVGQLRKTGGSIFEFENINLKIYDEHDKPFVSLRELNEVRRRAVKTAEEIILKNAFPKNKIKQDNQSDKSVEAANIKKGFTVSVSSIEQYRAVIEFEKENSVEFVYIYVPQYILISCTEEFLKDSGRIVIEPPIILKDKEYIKNFEELKKLKELGFKSLQVHNIAGFNNDLGFELIASHRLNITNGLAVSECVRSGITALMLSLELSIPQIRDITKNLCGASVEVLAYGYIPLMTTENCIAKNLDKSICPCGGEVKYMTDRLGKRFPVMRDGNSCRSILLNSCPVFMADKISDIKNIGVNLINLKFSVEQPKTVKLICEAYFGFNDYKPDDYTRMHYYKGII